MVHVLLTTNNSYCSNYCYRSIIQPYLAIAFILFSCLSRMMEQRSLLPRRDKRRRITKRTKKNRELLKRRRKGTKKRRVQSPEKKRYAGEVFTTTVLYFKNVHGKETKVRGLQMFLLNSTHHHGFKIHHAAGKVARRSCHSCQVTFSSLSTPCEQMMKYLNSRLGLILCLVFLSFRRKEPKEGRLKVQFTLQQGLSPFPSKERRMMNLTKKLSVL